MDYARNQRVRDTMVRMVSELSRHRLALLWVTVERTEPELVWGVHIAITGSKTVMVEVDPWGDLSDLELKVRMLS